MGNEEMLVAIKKMFVEERAITDTKLEAMQKATGSKLESMQADTDSKFEAMDKRLDAMQKATDSKLEVMQADTDSKFEAMDKRLDVKIEAAQKETIQQIKALLENGVEKQIRLLAEDHAQILARLPDAEEQGEIKARVTTLEHVVSDHTRQINELRQAQ